MSSKSRILRKTHPLSCRYISHRLVPLCCKVSFSRHLRAIVMTAEVEPRADGRDGYRVKRREDKRGRWKGRVEMVFASATSVLFSFWPPYVLFPAGQYPRGGHGDPFLPSSSSSCSSSSFFFLLPALLSGDDIGNNTRSSLPS